MMMYMKLLMMRLRLESHNPQKTCHNQSIVFQAWMATPSLIFIVVLLDFWACFTFENPE